jgi:predicted ATPase/Tfp pilus assembly protein PilF/DNA-binding XRE family transcriptional regulator
MPALPDPMETERAPTFAQLLRRYRLAAGLSQEALAERANLSVRAISDLERGARRAPYRDTVEMLVTALGLPPADRARLHASVQRRRALAIPPTDEDLPLPVLLTPLTPLLGREREEAQTVQLLRREWTRLLTLTGVGGVGKTRLALQVAKTLERDFEDGARTVSLSAIRRPGLVLPTIAQALDVPERGKPPPLESLTRHLRSREMLLLLDNFEQVVESAPLLLQLLAGCPSLKMLVTSRVPLHVRGEQEVEVRPLAVPEPGTRPSIDDLELFPASVLFRHHLQAVNPDFRPAAADAPVLAEICRRLEGLPLAIELAAMRAKVLPLPVLLARLEHRLELLAGGPRDLPPRQQTMRDTIAWSYELLDLSEQALFRRLAVFVGGCELTAVAAVCHGGDARNRGLLDGLSSLVDKSLLRGEVQTDGRQRFSMLEIVRDYALERLGESSDRAIVRRRHAEYYLALAEEAEPQMAGAEPAIWVVLLKREQDNLRAALDWAQETGDVMLGLRLASALWQFWYRNGYVVEGSHRLGSVLRLEIFHGNEESRSIRAKALVRASVLAVEHGEQGRALELATEALALFRSGEDKEGTAFALNVLGTLAKYQGHYAEANRYFEDSLAILRDLGGGARIARVLNNLGAVAIEHGEYDRAVGLFEESLTIKRTLGDSRGIADTLNNLADVARHRGDLERALSLYAESLETYRSVGETRGVAVALLNMGEAARDQGDLARAIAYCEEGLRLGREVNTSWVVACALKNLADPLLDRGEHERAAAAYVESLSLHREASNDPEVLSCLEGFARLARAEGSPAEAARIWGATTALRESMGAPTPTVERGRTEAEWETLRHELGDDAWETHLSAGRALSMDQIVGQTLEHWRLKWLSSRH